MSSPNSDARYDVFKRLPDGATVWITTLEDFEEAKQRMARFGVISPAKYFVYFQGKGVVAEYSPSSQDWVEVT
jgi:hypothetical protein